MPTRFENSKANRALLDAVTHLPAATLRDLYEEYPDFNVDAPYEQSLLIDHQVIVWQHPLYMYGAPALLKQWIDMVLEYGWAHGGGDHLKGKTIFNALTAGGARDVYGPGGSAGYTMRQFLAPFEQTARLCKTTYLPPFVVHGTYRLSTEEMEGQGRLYLQLLERLALGEYDPESAGRYEYLNDWLAGRGGRVTS